MQKLPLTVEELIHTLDKMYPDRCPPPDMPMHKIMFRSGQRSVVDHLVHLLGEDEIEDI